MYNQNAINLLKDLNEVKIDEEYDLTIWEIKLLNAVNDDNLIDAGYDFFKYGYLQGQKSERDKTI